MTSTVDLADAVLEAFTGEYGYGSGAVLAVTRDGGQLSAQYQLSQITGRFYGGTE